MSEYYLIAKLIAAEGSKGEIKIYPVSDNPKRFKKLKKVYIDFWGEKKSFSLEYVKVKRESFFFKFENFDDKQSVEMLIGKDVFIDKRNLKKLPAGYYYIHDIIGCTVIKNDCEFGKVIDVYKLKANDVFVIKKSDGEEILIPAVKDFIENVNTVERILVLKSGDDFYDDDEN